MKINQRIIASAILFFLSVKFACAVPISVTALGSPINCVGGYAHVRANVSGGTPPYSYLWSTTATTSNIMVTTGGTYTVTVTDALSNTATSSYTVIYQPSSGGPAFTANAPWPSAFDDSTLGWTGIMFINCTECDVVNGGVAFATGQFSGPLPQETISANGYAQFCDIAPDTLQIYVTSGGCTSNTQMGVMEAYPPLCTPPSLNILPSCNTVNSGQIIVSAVPIFCPPYDWMYYFDRVSINSPSLGFGAFIDLLSFPNPPFIFSNLAPANDYYVGFTRTCCNCNGPAYANFWTLPYAVGVSTDTCGTVSGHVYVDYNSNCIYNFPERNNDRTVIGLNSTYYTTTNNAGQYSINVPLGNYAVTHSTLYPVYNECPVTSYNITLSASTPFAPNIDFADTSDGIPDISIYLTSGMPRVGFPFSYYINVSNLTITPANNLTVSLNYDDTVSFVTGNFTPTVNIPGHLEWTISSLPAYASQNFSATFNVPPIPALTGYVLNAGASVTAALNEINLSNNTDAATATIVNSADPNAKAVMPEGIGPQGYITVNDSVLKYTIHFQNVGSAPAVNISIADSLSVHLNPMTFVPGASSHSYTYSMSGEGRILFRFQNINLAASSVNEPASHGYVSFRIRLHPNLPVGTVIENTAHNYFDFNAPVSTNTTVNTITVITGSSDHEVAVSSWLSPNPVTKELRISPAVSGIENVEIYDVIGECVKTFIPNTSHGEALIDVSELSAGIYFVRVRDDKNKMLVMKFIKE